MFHVAFVQIAEFDWLPGRQKGLILEKNVKNLLRNHKVDAADTFYAPNFEKVGSIFVHLFVRPFKKI